MWNLYILRCADAALYIGITTDVSRRVAEHQAQGKKCAKYLRGKGPLALVFSTEAGTRSEASRLELRLKKLSKTEKENFINREKH